jgi:hypothetical protein
LGHGVEDPLIWGVVLPRIAVAARNLTSLVLLQGDFIAENIILEFIARLPHLLRLTISSNTQSEIYHSGGSPIQLRHLESLRAPPTFVRHFLRHPACFPKLKSLCVLWPQLYVPSNATSLGPALAAIIQEVQAHGLAPRIAVAVSTLMYRAATVGLLPPQYSALDRVTALEICTIPFFYTDIADMAAWIARFRHVGRLEITLSRSAAADADFRVGVGRLVRAIKATEWLKEAVVNGEICELASP